MSAAEQLHTYPSPNPKLTLNCYQLTVFGLVEGKVCSCLVTDIDFKLLIHLSCSYLIRKIFHTKILYYFSDYPSYHRQQSRERVHNFNDYPQSFNDRREVAAGQEDDSEWMDEYEYKLEKGERNLRLNVPLANNDDHHNRRIFHEDHGPLPPEVPVNWDKINSKNGGNFRSDKRHQKTADYDSYDNFKARRLIRHRQDSSSDTVGSRHDIKDSSQGNAKLNVGRSSKKSSVFNSEGNSGVRSEEKSEDANSYIGEKKVSHVPLATGMDSIVADNSHLQGNQLQTEKAAFTEEAAAAADTKVGAGKVMVKGKVQQVKADIDQGPNPEKTYKRVEDFFQSQRESSIVEVPNSVKKEEASKLFKDNFIPVKEDGSDQINKEQGNISLFLLHT